MQTRLECKELTTETLAILLHSPTVDKRNFPTSRECI